MLSFSSGSFRRCNLVVTSHRYVKTEDFLQMKPPKATRNRDKEYLMSCPPWNATLREPARGFSIYLLSKENRVLRCAASLTYWLIVTLSFLARQLYKPNRYSNATVTMCLPLGSSQNSWKTNFYSTFFSFFFTNFYEFIYFFKIESDT